MKIAPSILSGDFAYFGEAVKQAEQGGADYIHVDVMDGHFVPNITIGPKTVSAIKKYTSLPLDVHLMISNPDQYIDNFIDAGADILTIHAEASTHLHRSLRMIKDRDIPCGVALNPATPLCMLDHIIPEIDLLLIMTVNPGFGGQSFIPHLVEKISLAKAKIEEASNNIILQVDGGINKDNIGQMARLGVDICVAGSAVYASGNVKHAISQLKKNSC